MKTFVAGTFDCLHVGHQWLLWNAYWSSEELVIVVARDETVQRVKGFFPSQSETQRLARIEAEFAQGGDRVSVRLGRADGDYLRTLREESPDILVLGYDQRFDPGSLPTDTRDAVQVRRVEAYYPEFFKSTYFR